MLSVTDVTSIFHCNSVLSVTLSLPAYNSEGTGVEFSLNFLCVNEIVLINMRIWRLGGGGKSLLEKNELL